MYYRVNRRYNVLQVSDAYATLKDILQDGTLDFEFRYTAAQSDLVKQGTVTVNVSVFTKTVKKRPIVGRGRLGKIDAKEVIQNVITDMPAAKSAIKSREDHVLVSKKSDASSKVDNEAVPLFLRGTRPAAIQALHEAYVKAVPAGELISANDKKPIIDVTKLQVNDIHGVVSSSVSEDTQRLAHRLILQRGIDPSAVSELPSSNIYSQRAFQGTNEPIQRYEPEHGTLARLRNQLTIHPGLLDPVKTIDQVEENRLVNIVTTEPVDNVEVPVRVKFKPPSKKVGSRDSSDVFVKFELLDTTTNHAIDTVTRTLDVPTHVRIFKVPFLQPNVQRVRSDISSRANLEIVQVDPRANEVHIFKKSINTAVVNDDDYVLIDVQQLSSGHKTIVQVDSPTYDAAIYRVVPAYSGIVGFTYTNVVIPPKKYRPVRALALTTSIIENGVSVEARRIPPDVIALQFLQRNKTTFEDEFSPISDPQLIDDAVRQADHVAVVTQNVLDNNVYEFAAKMFFRSGTQETITGELLEYILATPGKVDIKVSGINVSHDTEPNVTFSVSLDIVDSNIDAVKALLEQQGIKSYFDGDIAKQRDELKALLAYSIHRINLMTGEREDLGVITQPDFDDSEVRKKFATQSLQYGHKYRYVITAVARSAETVLEKLEKNAVDTVTKKPYSFMPSKFLHPLTLRRGIIVSPAGLKTKYSKTTFEHGVLGSTTIVDVSLDETEPRIIDGSVVRFNKELAIVNWRVEGPMEMIDHFIIMKEVHGLRTVLGTAHTTFQGGVCQWLHKLSSHDRGEFNYVIVPMLSTYKYGSSITTNSLLVEDT